MKLNKILNNMEYSILNGNLDIDITDVIYDTRNIKKDCIFVCIKGSKYDSHDFIEEAIKLGAKAIVVDRDIKINSKVVIIKVKNTREALSLMSSNYFDNPAKKLCMIGITGTKGKTTSSYMIKSILENNNKKVGIIGTIGTFIGDESIKVKNTTPESYELHKIFRKMVDEECTHCVMEVSSQGIKQNRVTGIVYDIGIFTNLSEDHISPTEHADMEEYLYYKSLLFKQSKIGLVNIDDKSYKMIVKEATCPIYTYGKNKESDLYFYDVELLQEKETIGSKYKVSGKINSEIKLGMPGFFNVYNSMSSLLISDILNLDIEKTKEALNKIKVRGRVEDVHISEDYYVIIDYAHNEESVESLLTMIKGYNPKRIVCIFGGGGNRSVTRRYAMGEVCSRMGDFIILTMDNPRDEEISNINNDIKIGMKNNKVDYIEIEDRKEAIYYALDNAQKGDIILLLGKGHETYQEIKGKKYHFSELEILKEYKNRK